MIRKLVLAITILLLMSFAIAQNETNLSENISAVDNNTSVKSMIVSEDIVTCTQDKCDSECVICDDKICRDPGYICTGKLTVSKIIPNQTILGVSQINILIKNEGNINFRNINGIISGDGISTISSSNIDLLNPNDKDYLFIVINSTKTGNLDFVLKVQINDNTIEKTIGQLIVLGEEKPIIQPQENSDYNKTGLDQQLTELKKRLGEIDELYAQKINDGFPIEIYYDNIKESQRYIANAQLYLLDKEYAKASANMDIAKEYLDNVKIGIDSAKIKEESLSQKIKDNILYVGSIAAALISILTIYNFTSSKINKENIKKLKKITLKNQKNIEQEIKEEVKDQVKEEVKKEVGKKR